MLSYSWVAGDENLRFENDTDWGKMGTLQIM